MFVLCVCVCARARVRGVYNNTFFEEAPSSVQYSVVHFPGFFRDFDCFDSENQWDGKVVFVGF